ncbi:hypothetical protein IFM89_025660 [Coptis chinensis]|uniref:Phosphatidate cytidylyltransferase, mitochondrial n=1 Tax=Coptis chinensis TaxID=261450 RepID=A0A835H8B3_9MAGN|nr:hypothetical protein IFM89_025660 [Coptis chinensis]
MANNQGLAGFLDDLPPVEFCCTYGSSLLNNRDKTTMVDYILGVSDPMQWHTKNLELNSDHYASLSVQLGGAKLITQVADVIGVGVHFNPYVEWDDKMIKYGVVRMHDLVQDIFSWEHFYLSGRLQKPVNVLKDNLDIENINSVSLRAATSAALLLLPPKFTEAELYAKICSLSYMGDLRMLFAEDKNKVNKIVEGQFPLFRKMYKPFIEEYAAKDLLRYPAYVRHFGNIVQDCGLPATSVLVSSLPSNVKRRMGMKSGEKINHSQSGRAIYEVAIASREEAASCMQKVLRRIVLVSSTRQAISGVLAAGGVHAAQYLSNKMSKWWKS